MVTRYGVAITPAMQRVLDRFGGQLPQIRGAEEPENEPAKAKPDPSDSGTGKGDDLGDAGKAAIEKERKARRDAEKALKDAEAAREDAERKVKEHEDAEKTELEREKERASKAEADAATAKRTALQYEVAAAKGMKLTAAARLSGDTKEAMEADADKLIEDFGNGVLAASDSDKQPEKPAGKPQGRGGDGGATPPPGQQEQYARLRGSFPQLAKNKT